MNKQELQEIRLSGMPEETEGYPTDFPAFIDQMLLQHKMKRKTIAEKTGLS